MIEIISPGVAASIQDIGRFGFRAIGVGSSGAMDAGALRIANAMLGNPEHVAGIEITLGGFELEALRDVDFALTGAQVSATLDGIPLSRWWSQTLKKGQRLKAGYSASGMRAYLAVGGGIDVPLVLGSRATDLKGAFGGHEGRLLSTGDRLRALNPKCVPEPFAFGLSPRAYPHLWREPVVTNVVRFIPAREWAEHTQATRDAFTDSEWTISTQSNRVGYRMTGPALTAVEHHGMLSHGILPGTIQLPPSGHPVVHMVDANTAGGYPKLGVVIGPDLALLAQVPLGKTVRFLPSTINEARAAVAAQNTMVAEIKVVSSLNRDGGRCR